jgi:hypothetical protein
VKDKVVETAVSKVTDYAMGQVKEKATELAGQAYTKLTGQAPPPLEDDPISDSARQLPRLLTGLANPAAGLREIRHFVNHVTDNFNQWWDRQTQELFGAPQRP